MDLGGAGAGKLSPSRVRTSGASSSMDIGPTARFETRVPGRVRSSWSRSAPTPSDRIASRRATGSSVSLRSAYRSTLTDAVSSHWRSSMATTAPPVRARDRSAASTAVGSANGSPARRRRPASEAARPRAHGTVVPEDRRARGRHMDPGGRRGRSARGSLRPRRGVREEGEPEVRPSPRRAPRSWSCRSRPPRRSRARVARRRLPGRTPGPWPARDRARPRHQLFGRSGRPRCSPRAIVITSRPNGNTRRRSREEVVAGPTGFEPAISSVTGWHVWPLHHGPAGVPWQG